MRYYEISKKYLTFEIRHKMVDWQQSNVYYIKMAGKIDNLVLVSFTVINSFILTKVVAIFLKIVCTSHQIRIRYFSSHFYVVNFRLVAIYHFKPDFES